MKEGGGFHSPPSVLAGESSISIREATARERVPHARRQAVEMKGAAAAAAGVGAQRAFAAATGPTVAARRGRGTWGTRQGRPHGDEEEWKAARRRGREGKVSLRLAARGRRRL